MVNIEMVSRKSREETTSSSEKSSQRTQASHTRKTYLRLSRSGARVSDTAPESENFAGIIAHVWTSLHSISRFASMVIRSTCRSIVHERRARMRWEERRSLVIKKLTKKLTPTAASTIGRNLIFRFPFARRTRLVKWDSNETVRQTVWFYRHRLYANKGVRPRTRTFSKTLDGNIRWRTNKDIAAQPECKVSRYSRLFRYQLDMIFCIILHLNIVSLENDASAIGEFLYTHVYIYYQNVNIRFIKTSLRKHTLQ